RGSQPQSDCPARLLCRFLRRAFDPSVDFHQANEHTPVPGLLPQLPLAPCAGRHFMPGGILAFSGHILDPVHENPAWHAHAAALLMVLSAAANSRSAFSSSRSCWTGMAIQP